MTTDPNVLNSVAKPDVTQSRLSRRRLLAALPAVMTVIPAYATTAQSSAVACIQRGASRAPQAPLSDSMSDDWMRVALAVIWLKDTSVANPDLSGCITRLSRGIPASSGEFACLRTSDGSLWKLQTAINGYSATRLAASSSYRSRSARTDLYALLKVDSNGAVLGLAFESAAQSGVAVTSSCYVSAVPLRRA